MQIFRQWVFLNLDYIIGWRISPDRSLCPCLSDSCPLGLCARPGGKTKKQQHNNLAETGYLSIDANTVEKRAHGWRRCLWAPGGAGEQQNVIFLPFPAPQMLFLETAWLLVIFIIIHNGTLATGDKKRQRRDKLTSQGRGEIEGRGRFGGNEVFAGSRWRCRPLPGPKGMQQRQGGCGMSSSSARYGDGNQLRNHMGGGRLSGSLSLRISLRSGLFRIGQDSALKARGPARTGESFRWAQLQGSCSSEENGGEAGYKGSVQAKVQEEEPWQKPILLGKRTTTRKCEFSGTPFGLNGNEVSQEGECNWNTTSWCLVWLLKRLIEGWLWKWTGLKL